MAVIDRNTQIAVIGLGVLGGSYVHGFHDAGYNNIIGIDVSQDAVDTALKNQWIRLGGSDPALVQGSDIVISALYPHTFVEWVKENQKYFKSGSILTDVTGVKRAVIDQINAELRSDVEYIACHPMAGRESRGIQYSDPSRFLNANFIIVPTEKNTERAIDTARSIAEILKFGKICTLTPEAHDKMIGFVSQLTHVIAVCLMNANDNTNLADYTGDSFRDLTRIANINEQLWPELFLLNKDNLIREIDDFTAEMKRFEDLIKNDDIDGMKQKLIQSTERRKHFNREENPVQKEIEQPAKMKIMVLNGPNLNMVGIREKNIYGTQSFDDLIHLIKDEAEKRNVEVDCRQSNHEGTLVDWIQEAWFSHYDGIVINPGAYTHTSVALADAVKAIAPIPVVEVHISDINAREEFRHISYEAPYCLDQIKGKGFRGYIDAMDEIIASVRKKQA